MPPSATFLVITVIYQRRRNGGAIGAKVRSFRATEPSLFTFDGSPTSTMDAASLRWRSATSLVTLGRDLRATSVCMATAAATSLGGALAVNSLNSVSRV